MIMHPLSTYTRYLTKTLTKTTMHPLSTHDPTQQEPTPLTFKTCDFILLGFLRGTYRNFY